MYALCEDEQVTIFSEYTKSISYKNFFHNYKSYKVIFDVANTDFSLEKLKNCSLFDAFKVLYCKKKALLDFEDTFLIPKDNFSCFRKTNYYIQKISFKNNGLFRKLNLKEGVFLIESVIYEFCKNITEIDEETWWLYVAKHNVNTRIIAGISGGIVLSRFLSENLNISDEVLKTIIYLKRFGLEKIIKIITPLNEIEKSLHRIENYKIFKISQYTNTTLVEFLSRAKGIKKICVRDSYITRFSISQIYRILYVAIFCLGCLWVYLHESILENEKSIALLKKDVTVSHENLRFKKINGNNFLFVERLVAVLKDSINPIDIFRKISKVCNDNKIKAELISLENSNLIKIKTALGNEESKKLLNISNTQFEIKIEKPTAPNEEYEELGVDKKSIVIICIHIK
ncbi:MAG: hypothetical protein LBS23_00495 [Holosporaceae bacterium]|jgi:hypothetical protein|nr:hypothetical protein [Holosporaceae bacterium]